MKRGLPRPMTMIDRTRSNHTAKDDDYSFGPKWNNRRYPHPYTAQEYSVSNIHRGRLRESVTFKLCGVCGEAVKDTEVGLILWNDESENLTSWTDWLHSEAGPYHITCMEIAYKRCPHMAVLDKFILATARWDDVKDTIQRYTKDM